MSNYVKSILFAAALSIICGGLLTLASTGLKAYQLKNIALDRQKNILRSVGLIGGKKTSLPETIDRLYQDNIKQVWIDSNGNFVPKDQKTEKDLPLYLQIKGSNIESYVIPLDSKGLWGRILGYLAMKNDGSTVSGFTVYSHSETPGLGGEIEKEWFQKNFAGKKITDEQGNLVSITIAKGKVRERITDKRQQNFVDGISGATLTGKFLSGGLKDTLVEYEPLSERFRKNAIKSVGD